MKTQAAALPPELPIQHALPPRMGPAPLSGKFLGNTDASVTPVCHWVSESEFGDL